MLRTKDILDEKDPRVRAKNTEVEFPLCEEYKSIIPEMLKHLRYSQIEKYSKKYNLRPGMGLAAPQLGINKDGVPFEVVNPKPSRELLKALKEGEDILQEINNGKRKGYNNMEDLIKSLNEE
jgi:peptide deformylase